MTDLTSTLAISASAMRAQATRLRLSSENIANVDTPGYHRKMLSFQSIADPQAGATLVRAGPVHLDQSVLTQVYNPGHPLAGPDGYYAGSNVNLVVEIADARESQRSYEANLKMFDQARKMAGAALDILRR